MTDLLWSGNEAEKYIEDFCGDCPDREICEHEEAKEYFDRRYEMRYFNTR